MRNTSIKSVIGAAVTAFVAGGAITGASQQAAAQTYTVKIAHALPPGDPRDLGARETAKWLNASKICNFKAQVYPSGQLGGTTDVIEAAQIGSVEMVIMPASFLVGFQPLIGIFDFPFFWPRDREKLLKLHQGAAMKKLLATTTEKGIVSIAVWHSGYKTWTGDKPLNIFSAFNGLKARVMPSKVLKRQDELMGMTPISMPFSETYSALQNKAIDAQENPIATSYVMKFYEVQKYMALTNHGTLDQVIMMSKIFWDRLPETCKQAIHEAVAAGGKVCVAKTYSLIDKAMKTFSTSDMKVVEVSEKNWQEMREKVLPGVKKFYISENGPKGGEIVEAFEKEIATMK